jgi:hypothetical protein
MQRWKIPKVYTDFVANLLHGRSTCLHFDDYVSEPIMINNGIGQGNPLSMSAFLFYNADLLDITESRDESTLAFVDDSLAMVEGDNFEAMTDGLQNIMDREGGGFDWGTRHNSRFKIDKLAVMHCTNKHMRDPANARKFIPLSRPELKLRGRTI